MLENILWNLFENTGRVDVYLIYKEHQPSTYQHVETPRTYEVKKCANSDLA